jgi:hypothetical protein
MKCQFFHLFAFRKLPYIDDLYHSTVHRTFSAMIAEIELDIEKDRHPVRSFHLHFGGQSDGQPWINHQAREPDSPTEHTMS